MAKAVIFDKDGVIVETSRLHFEKWKKTFARYNKKLTREFHLKNLSGRSSRENIKTHLDSAVSNEDLSKILQEQIDFILAMYDKYVTVVPGFLDFLKKLKKNNIPTALATSSRKESSDFIIDRLKIRSYFRSIINGDNVINAKPDPEIYFKAAKNLHVKPYDCVVFEDSYSGVEAAKQAGMKVILVMTSHTQAEIPAVDLAIKDFTKICIREVMEI